MEKKIVWLGIVVMVVGLCSSGALATTLGPPIAGLDAGQFSVGVEYSNSEISIEGDDKFKGSVDGVPVDLGPGASVDIEDDFESDMIFANLGYGVSDKLEVFGRLGMADLGAEHFSSNQEFAWGLGAKATFYEEAALKLGALIQMTWGSAEDEMTEEFFGEEIDLSYEIDWYEIKIAVGPSYELMEGVSVYGGPFYHMFRGDLDADGSVQVEGEGDPVDLGASLSVDLEEQSQFGGYIGAQIDLAENIPLCVEYQLTGDADIFGAGLVYRF